MNGLKKRIDDAGVKYSWLAKRMGITRAALYKKLAGVHEFKASEIGVLIDVLHLSPKEQHAYFFANDSD